MKVGLQAAEREGRVASAEVQAEKALWTRGRKECSEGLDPLEVNGTALS